MNQILFKINLSIKQQEQDTDSTMILKLMNGWTLVITMILKVIKHQ